jgi:hypothetical protein
MISTSRLLRSSDLGEAAIGDEIAAGQVAAVARRQEKGRAGDLLRLADPPERDPRSVEGEELLLLLLRRGAPTVIGVSTPPGLRLFTRIFRSLSSAAHVRANDRTAAFVALYAP